MKKINVLKFVLLFSTLVGCNQNKIIKGNLETVVYFASDLHLYSNNLMSENNEIYTKDIFTSDGRVQEFDYQLVEALVDIVNSDKPDYLVLTGDLSYNGEKDSLLELKKMLDKVNEDTQVLVIPGNHDCYSINPFSCLNDDVQRIKGVTYEEFKEIFSPFGYRDAYSYDEDSLSYIYKLSEDKWILMLDTSLSEYNYEFDMNIVGGFIDESTINWISENLEYAKKNNIEVISATHHNLLVHNKIFKDMYTLTNSEQILELFSKYQIRLNFSGHLHIQSIKSQLVNEYEIYDIASNGLLDYGNRYGALEIYDNCYNYNSNKIKVNYNNIDFENYSFDTFYREYYNKSIVNNENKFNENGKNVTDFLSEVNAYYFDGEYEKITDLKKKNKSIYKLIKENTEKYDDSYTGSILEVKDENQHSLLIEK